MVILSGGRVSKFRRSVIRQSLAIGPPVRHRYFNRASVIGDVSHVYFTVCH